MRNFGISLYLNGIRMSGGREPPVVDTDRFIRAMGTDLMSPNDKRKHRCSPECKRIWTIGIGETFTEEKKFMDCVPK